MWKRAKRPKPARGADRTDFSPVVLCDLCAAVSRDDEAVRTYVPDSSYTHPVNDWFDGLRLLTACGKTHLAELRKHYRSRPFVEEELWAAKITRALTSGPPVLTLVELGCRTGLHEPDLRRAIAWHNQRAREGGNGPPSVEMGDQEPRGGEGA
ncbi:hypothetical protein [Streptomyces sp. TP-A0874]|uniref:hypothetical protein n=1 Tax=Streptomyces sp. TP-A0874 TaxID=549819 RepID=UPI000853F035|nr:hypothetical protein [Streptomyces sp. TP-A0874]